METVVYISLGSMLIFGVAAVMLHSMIKSAIALAAGSVALGIVMFELGSVWAAMFEISVCSGLVTVIFISAVSLSNMDKKDIEKLYEDKKRMSLLPALLIIGGVVLVAAALSSGFPLSDAVPAPQAADNFREILWNHRQADIWGQIIIVVTGAAAVVVLFRESDGS
jgi:NADH-quinone oxidoreductase subunit J